MASNLTMETKVLQDTLVLFAGVYFAMNAIEIFADPNRKRNPVYVIRALSSIMFSIFLIGLYLAVLSPSGGGGGNIGIVNNVV